MSNFEGLILIVLKGGGGNPREEFSEALKSDDSSS